MELDSTQSALGAILLSFLSIRCLSYALNKYVSYPSSIREGPARKQWIYRNTWISLTHSTITAVLSVISFFNEPGMLTDMISTWNSLAYYVLCFSIGYFIHDTFDLLFNDLKNSGVLLFHHVVVLGAFIISVISRAYIGFATCALLIEINSVFLHLRRIMSFHNISKTSLVYEANGILLLVTFVAFRFLTSGWMLNYIIKNSHRLSGYAAIYGSCGMGVIIIINIVLFMVIWNNDFKKRFQIKDDY